jgi:hypothetical protein
MAGARETHGKTPIFEPVRAYIVGARIALCRSARQLEADALSDSNNSNEYNNLRAEGLSGEDAVSRPVSTLPPGLLFKPVRIFKIEGLFTPLDPIAREIAQHLFENRDVMYAHLPAADRPRFERAYWPSSTKPGANPFLPMPQPVPQTSARASALTTEVPRLYAALAFAMWQYGSLMNAHLTICWKLLGVTNHTEAAGFLSRYNKQAAKWLGVGLGDKVARSRVSRRVAGSVRPHLYVYVHENAHEKGFHSHELMNVPPDRAQEFMVWSRTYLGHLCKRADVDERAVFFSPASKVLKQFKPYEGNRESFAVERQWNWFKYITKSLHPDHIERSADGAGWRHGRDIFGIDRPFMNTPPVHCRRLAGWSEKLGEMAQRDSGFTSKFTSGDWSNMYDGSELDDFRAYCAEVAEEMREEVARAELQAMLQHIRI